MPNHSRKISLYLRKRMQANPSAAHATERKGWVSARTLLSVFVVLTSVAIAAQTYWAIVQDRAVTIRAETESAQGVVRLLAEFTQQQLNAADSRLETIINAVSTLGASQPVEDKSVHEAINEMLKNSRTPGAMQFVNLEGKRWASSNDFPPFVNSAEERPYVFQLLGQPHNTGIVIGQPMERLVDGHYVLPLARNLFDIRHRHVGIVSSEVEISYFNKSYLHVAQDNRANIQLISDQGVGIVNAYPNGNPVESIARDETVHNLLLLNESEGIFEKSFSQNDQLHYLYFYKKVTGFPMGIVYGRDFREILSSWEDRSWERIGFSTLFIVLHLLLTYYLLQNMDKLRRSEKLAMLGQMSAGITHELSQPVTAIRSFAENAVMLLARGQVEQVKINLAHISNAGERMGHILGQLMGLARKSSDACRPVELAQAVGNVTSIMQADLQSHSVGLELHLDDSVFIMGDSGRIEQVLVNLFRNALDAMELVPKKHIRVQLTREGSEAVIRVHDNGPGMSKEAKEQLFEPFFTTKVPGKGLGLGLAISQAIIRGMGGTISACNLAQGGAQFEIRLPVSVSQ